MVVAKVIKRMISDNYTGVREALGLVHRYKDGKLHDWVRVTYNHNGIRVSFDSPDFELLPAIEGGGASMSFKNGNFQRRMPNVVRSDPGPAAFEVAKWVPAQEKKY